MGQSSSWILRGHERKGVTFLKLKNKLYYKSNICLLYKFRKKRKTLHDPTL